MCSLLIPFCQKVQKKTEMNSETSVEQISLEFFFYQWYSCSVTKQALKRPVVLWWESKRSLCCIICSCGIWANEHKCGLFFLLCILISRGDRLCFKQLACKISILVATCFWYTAWYLHFLIKLIRAVIELWNYNSDGNYTDEVK